MSQPITYHFTVKTLAGLLIPCTHQTEELNIPDLYYCVWNHLPDTLHATTWNIQLLSGEEDEDKDKNQEEKNQEDQLLETVRQGGVLYLLVHTDRQLDAFIKQTPFDYTTPLYPGVTFIRRTFIAKHTAGDSSVWKWEIEAYIGLSAEGLVLYHANDVEMTGTRQFSPSTSVVSYSNVLDLIVRAYDHQWSVWNRTPYPLLPPLYDTWTRLLEEEMA